jgi:hypothetical protein
MFFFDLCQLNGFLDPGECGIAPNHDIYITHVSVMIYVKSKVQVLTL